MLGPLPGQWWLGLGLTGSDRLCLSYQCNPFVGPHTLQPYTVCPCTMHLHPVPSHPSTRPLALSLIHLFIHNQHQTLPSIHP